MNIKIKIALTIILAISTFVIATTVQAECSTRYKNALTPIIGYHTNTADTGDGFAITTATTVLGIRGDHRVVNGENSDLRFKWLYSRISETQSLTSLSNEVSSEIGLSSPTQNFELGFSWEW